jgi:hypothetical protein
MRARLAGLGTAGRLTAFAGSAALGAATGGSGPAPVAAEAHGMAMEHGATTPAARQRASGLATTAGGFTFAPVRTRFGVGRSDFRFRIVDAHGEPAHDFTLEGGVRLHLIVVRRDFVGYTHVHPALQPDGSWRVPLDFREPGVYRAYADFEQHGEKTVVGHDLFVAGAMQARPLPPVRRVTTVGGYRVELAPATLHAGEAGVLHFDVSRDGGPVERFESYVGMRGHLIALRDGDLAYAHVHALDGTTTGRIDFKPELEAAGAYRLFLQFKLDGRVYTAPFTIEVQR